MTEAHLSNGIANIGSHTSQAQLEDWVENAKNQALRGQVNQRILLLSKQNPDLFAIQIEGQKETFYVSGDTDQTFPLMSVVKPFLLLYLLTQLGQEQVFQWVGTTPSNAPFNSLDQLIADGGKPRNPMINSGAISLSSHLPGRNAVDACDRFCRWLNQHSGSNLSLSEEMLTSVRQIGREPNLALTHYLIQAGRIEDLERTLDIYEQACCLSGTVSDLARLGRLLAFETSDIAYAERCAVNALMLTCGLYEASSTYAVQIGLPMKSGISGALLTVVPGQAVLAAYSPALDNIGNPIAGLTFVQQVTQALRLSLFG